MGGDGTAAVSWGAGIGGLLGFGFLWADWSVAAAFAAGTVSGVNFLTSAIFVFSGACLGAQIGALAIPDVSHGHGHGGHH
mmetsp:Transcript_69342/g.108473  ORF Transcript_69342/g.108473 Transcript_69342/m.108473 type:complete len:80 (+) Transcript_69342:75-314(+)